MTQMRPTQSQNILVTGGAGFIGLRLCERLLSEKCRVTIVDNFSPQVHSVAELPSKLASQVKLIMGDVTDRVLVRDALRGQDVVVHLAAETGTGQSMYEIEKYERTNALGTAILLDVLANEKPANVKKVIVASSRAIYGEGQYRCLEHGVVFPEARTSIQLREGKFEPTCPRCGSECTMERTAETAPPNPQSVYGITKYTQERLVLMMARAMGISAYALRYQNVYGPGQSLKNPYTGILAIFTNLARANQDIEVFEDGRESRDFVYVDDAVEATWRAIQPIRNGVEALNVGGGSAISVLEVAEKIRSLVGGKSNISVTGAYREGDIRHNLANLERAKTVLDYFPTVTFEEGIGRFVEWAVKQAQHGLEYQTSLRELRERGLLNG